MKSPPSPARQSSRSPKNKRLPGDDPRAAALSILERLDGPSTTLDALLEEEAQEVSGLSPRDRALFNQLVYGVARWRLRLDAVIDAHANRPVSKIHGTVRNILRMGLFQILFMDRIPESAAVNTSVDLTRGRKCSRSAGFVNAVLRNAIRHPGRFSLPENDRTVKYLSLDQSFPLWLVSRWEKRMGFDETRRLCLAMNAIPPITLRCNELKGDLPSLLEALSGQAKTVIPRKEIPGAIDLSGPTCPIGKMQAFSEGRFAVQDGAAQLVSLFLSPRPGETVLDACAGLGGKTTHLAQLMENRGSVVAMDNVLAKLERLDTEARRLGVDIIETQQWDLDKPLETKTLPQFDRILLDAPCSGLGVLRRNPDAKWSSEKIQIERFADRQTRFLDHLAPLVKVKGTMVFAVCSMEPEENIGVVETFLKNHPNFDIVNRLDKTVDETEKIVGPFLGQAGCLCTFPHVHGLDGFFAARFTRIR